MMNPITKWLNWLIYGHVFSFAGVSATAIAAGVSAAATAASAGMALAGGKEGEAAAGAAGANAAGISAEQMNQLRRAKDNANKYQMPYYNTGTGAQNKLAYLLGTSNVMETPTDTSVGALLAQKNQMLQQHLASKPKLSKKSTDKEKKALKDWQARKQAINDAVKNIRDNGEDSPLYKQWAQKTGSTTKTELPIDSTYGSLLKDFTPADLEAGLDPGYAFEQEQGNRAIQNKMASIGQSSSGAAIKEAAKFNTGLARTGYQGAWDRYMQNRQAKTNTLFNMAGTGQRAGEVISNNENELGRNISNVLAQKGQAQQDAIYQGANSNIGKYAGLSKAAGGLADAVGTYAGYKSGMNNVYSSQGVDSSAWGA